jgi:hypothetical protein
MVDVEEEGPNEQSRISEEFLTGFKVFKKLSWNLPVPTIIEVFKAFEHDEFGDFSSYRWS